MKEVQHPNVSSKKEEVQVEEKSEAKQPEIETTPEEKQNPISKNEPTKVEQHLNESNVTQKEAQESEKIEAQKKEQAENGIAPKESPENLSDKVNESLELNDDSFDIEEDDYLGFEKMNLSMQQLNGEINLSVEAILGEKEPEEEEEPEVGEVKGVVRKSKPITFNKEVEDQLEELGEEVTSPSKEIHYDKWLNLMGLKRIFTKGDGHCQYRSVHGAIVQTQQDDKNSQLFNEGTKNLERNVAAEFFNNVDEELDILQLPYVISYLEKQAKEPQKYQDSVRTITRNYFAQLNDASIDFFLPSDFWGGSDTLRLLAKMLQRNIYVASATKEKGVRMHLYGECVGKKNPTKKYVGAWNDGGLREVIGKLIEEKQNAEHLPIVIFYHADGNHFETILWINDTIRSKKINKARALFQPTLKAIFVKKAPKQEYYADNSSEEENVVTSQSESGSEYSEEELSQNENVSSTRITRQTIKRETSDDKGKAKTQQTVQQLGKLQEKAKIESTKLEIESTVNWLKKQPKYKEHFPGKISCYTTLSYYHHWIKQDIMRMRILFQNLQQKFLLASKINLNYMLEWGQKSWEANQYNMLEKLVREGKLTGATKTQIEGWVKALRSTDANGRSSLLRSQAGQANLNLIDGTTLHKEIGGKKPVNIPENHWKLLNVIVEFVPVEIFNRLAIEASVSFKLTKQLGDINNQQIGYAHPKALETLYRNCRLSNKFDAIFTENSWESLEKYYNDIEEDSYFIVNELEKRISLGPRQG